MSKLRFSFGMVILAATSFVMSAAFGQIFSFQPNTTAKNPATSTGKTSTALSPDDFKNRVTVKSQQAQQELFQHAQNHLKQQSSQMPLPNAPPKPPKLNNMPQQQSTSSAPATPSTSGDSTPPSSQDNNTAATTTTTTTTHTPPATPALPVPQNNVAAPTDTAPPAQTQSQPYTGFGGGSPSPTHAPSQSSGGWNIKY